MEYNILSEDEIKSVAMTNLLKTLNDEQMIEQLSTKRHVFIVDQIDDYKYECTFGFNGSDVYLKLLFDTDEETYMNINKNMFAAGNVTTEDIIVKFLPTQDEKVGQTVTTICDNLDIISKYNHHFNCAKEDVENTVKTFAEMLEKTLTQHKTK